MSQGNYILTGNSAGVKPGILYIVYLQDMRSGIDPSPFQYLTAYSSRKTERSGKTSGKMTSAADVVEALISKRSRIIGMTRTGELGNIAVILRMCIGIVYERCHRSSGSVVIVYSRNYIRHIAFTALS